MVFTSRLVEKSKNNKDLEDCIERLQHQEIQICKKKKKNFSDYSF